LFLEQLSIVNHFVDARKWVKYGLKIGSNLLVSLLDLLIVSRELFFVMLETFKFVLDRFQAVVNLFLNSFTFLNQILNIVLVLVEDFGSQNFTQCVKKTSLWETCQLLDTVLQGEV
jgi:hypothetical protein